MEYRENSFNSGEIFQKQVTFVSSVGILGDVPKKTPNPRPNMYI